MEKTKTTKAGERTQSVTGEGNAPRVTVVTITRQWLERRHGGNCWLYNSDWAIRPTESDTVGGYQSVMALESYLRRTIQGAVRFVHAWGEGNAPRVKRSGDLIDDMRRAIKGEIISRLGSMEQAERWAAMYRNDSTVDKSLLALIDVLKA